MIQDTEPYNPNEVTSIPPSTIYIRLRHKYLMYIAYIKVQLSKSINFSYFHGILFFSIFFVVTTSIS